MKQGIRLLAFGALALAAASVASAHTTVSVGVGVSPYGYGYDSYYAPAPYYYRPAPYYAAPPIVYFGGGYWGGGRDRHSYRHGHDSHGEHHH